MYKILIAIFGLLFISSSSFAQDIETVTLCDSRASTNPEYTRFMALHLGDTIRFTVPTAFNDGITVFNDIRRGLLQTTALAERSYTNFALFSNRDGAVRFQHEQSYDFTITELIQGEDGEVIGLNLESENGHGYRLRTIRNTDIIGHLNQGEGLDALHFIPEPSAELPLLYQLVRNGEPMEAADIPSETTYNCRERDYPVLNEVNFLRDSESASTDVEI